MGIKYQCETIGLCYQNSYWVRISGNQAERAIRETANTFKDKYPRQNEIKDAYVDD